MLKTTIKSLLSVIALVTVTEKASAQVGDSWIAARAEAHEGWPELIVEINGERVQTLRIMSSDLRDYEITGVDDLSSIVQFGLYYENDLYERAGRDRNIFIERVFLGGEEFTLGEARLVGGSPHNYLGSLYEVGGLVWYRCEVSEADWSRQELETDRIAQQSLLNEALSQRAVLSEIWAEWQERHSSLIEVELKPRRDASSAATAQAHLNYLQQFAIDFRAGRSSWLVIQRDLGLGPYADTTDVSAWGEEELADEPSDLGSEVRDYLGLEPPDPSTDEGEAEVLPPTDRAADATRSSRLEALALSIRVYSTFAEHMTALEGLDQRIRDAESRIAELDILLPAIRDACPDMPNPADSE